MKWLSPAVCGPNKKYAWARALSPRFLDRTGRKTYLLVNTMENICNKQEYGIADKHICK